MRSPILALVFLVLSFSVLPGCGGEATAVGMWKLDVAAAARGIEAMMAERMATMPEAQRGMMQQFQAQMIEGLTNSNGAIELAADGTATMHEDQPDGSHQEITGTWSQVGDQVSITATVPGQPAPQTKNATLRGDELEVVESADGREFKMTFRRS